MRKHLRGTGIVVKCIFAFIFCVGLTQIEAFAAPGDIAIDATHFPDANFRAYVAVFDTNKDNVLSQSEIDAVTLIILRYGVAIYSLQGVEHFTNLSYLDCSGNNRLTSLDVSKNTALKILYCNGNKLTSLDVSKNTALEYLYCDHNKLTSLDVSKNTALKHLDCYVNGLTSLDVSKNTALKSLYCGYNQLTSLDVSKNTALEDLNCYDNKLTSLEVSKNTALKHLDCKYNELTSLDVSKNTALKDLNCNVNKLTSLDVSKNTALEDLSCGTNKLTSLDVSKNTALKDLNCNVNELTSLDVSKNTALESLACAGNQLTSLDVSKNTALKDLSCNVNELTSLDVSKNTALKVLFCNDNKLTSLDVSKNTALKDLNCHHNKLTSLDVSKNTALKDLSCNDNQLTSLDVSESTALERLYCNDNQLTSLDVSESTALERLYCNRNQLTSLDVSNNTALESLHCDGNQLTSLNVSSNTALRYLFCNDNELTSMDLSNNSELSFDDMSNNQRLIEFSKDNTFDLSTLPGFDISKASEFVGGTVTGNMLTATAEEITYEYATGRGSTVSFKLVKGHRVKFDGNGGQGAMDDIIIAAGIEEALPINAFTRDGHRFKGWNTKADGSGTPYTDGQVVKNIVELSGLTLYAQWTNIYTIKFDVNTGMGTMEDLSMFYDEDKSLTENVFTKTGYTFKEWNTAADGSGVSYIDKQSVKNLTDTNEGTVTLYAQWTPNIYTIKFDVNTGMGTMEDLSMVYDEDKSLTENVFTKTGYTFKEWNIAADGSGVSYIDKQSVKNLTDTNEGKVTLYAQWLPRDLVVDPVADQNYTGEKIEPPLTVKIAGKPLTPKVDYDVVYSDNIQPGTAKATITLKGGYTGTKTIEFTIKTPLKAKGLWVSKHENTYVTFNWTGTPNNNLATGWDVQYRTKLIGTQYAWSKWTSSRESGQTLSKRIYLKPNYTIEFKVKHETDTAYLRSVFTTPAGGKYQSITQCQIKVTSTASGALYRQGTKTLALKTGVNFSGDTGNIIYIKKGTSIKVTPNHVYPRSNYSKYPRLYPNHAWYDISDSTVASLTGTASTAGMKDGAVTIKGLKAGTTTIKITSCNGRGATLTIVVK